MNKGPYTDRRVLRTEKKRRLDTPNNACQIRGDGEGSDGRLCPPPAWLAKPSWRYFYSLPSFPLKMNGLLSPPPFGATKERRHSFVCSVWLVYNVPAAYVCSTCRAMCGTAVEKIRDPPIFTCALFGTKALLLNAT